MLRGLAVGPCRTGGQAKPVCLGRVKPAHRCHPQVARSIAIVVAEWARPSAHTDQVGKFAAKEQRKIAGSDLLCPWAKNVFSHSSGATALPA